MRALLAAPLRRRRRRSSSDPKVIVEHYTASSSFSSAFNTFAANAPDVEFGERPGVCAHFLIDRDGTIHQLVSLRWRCRHTVGLNHVAIGIEHVGVSDADVMGRPRQLAASLRLTRWLQARYGIPTRDVIGHAESLSSPYHHERVAAMRKRTHGDFAARDDAALPRAALITAPRAEPGKRRDQQALQEARRRGGAQDDHLTVTLDQLRQLEHRARAGRQPAARDPAGLRERRDLLEERLQRRRRPCLAAHVGELVAVVAVRVPDARRHDDQSPGRRGAPAPAGEEARAARRGRGSAPPSRGGRAASRRRRGRPRSRRAAPRRRRRRWSCRSCSAAAGPGRRSSALSWITS